MKLAIIRYGEIGLKGRNRKYFELALERNIRNQLPGVRTRTTGSRVYIETGNYVLEDVKRVLDKTFGVQNYSIGTLVGFELDDILSTCLELAETEVNKGKRSFKVETKRAYKKFPLRSMQLSAFLGEKVLERFPELHVDVHNPEFTIGVEIRNRGTLLFSNKFQGSGGMPVGVSGKGLLLLSGGIDSPVAGWYMLKRGIDLHAIHFASPPYTGEKALEKVIDLARLLSMYNGGRELLLYNVAFTKTQLSIHRSVQERYSLIIQRRAMMKIATEIAEREGYKAIVTGENVGQVASQTLENMIAISSATDKLVLRPLVGFDKIDTVEMAKKIGSFEISTRPYEDCCTVFVPKEPATKARVVDILRAEKDIDFSQLISEAIDETKLYRIKLGQVIKVESLEMDN
ncbi:thiamine biosynthesis protein ThiI [Kosmotoga arenicorallina S304]|uniref:Probable tRNA sulfurtransferase n=1 Tax=Kosmotoga arenicorallina S304 TaxID=1453497 RepID=A0A182C7R8_9BACT|nr:tRNA uracil 4-sulfurtransferase ThiI [Kosmotoga arenicorallina]OAA31364.1 thiamine biosynthesis protein ThiI [Kosmotoga arenicorallina S304]